MGLGLRIQCRTSGVNPNLTTDCTDNTDRRAFLLPVSSMLISGHFTCRLLHPESFHRIQLCGGIGWAISKEHANSCRKQESKKYSDPGNRERHDALHQAEGKPDQPKSYGNADDCSGQADE